MLDMKFTQPYFCDPIARDVREGNEFDGHELHKTKLTLFL